VKKLFKFLTGFLLLLVALGVWLFGCDGYMPWTHEVSHGELEAVGQRQNAQGKIVQKIFRQINCSSVAVLFTPEGPKHDSKYKIEYFLQQGDNPMVVLPFLSDKEFKYSERVENDVHSDLHFCDKFIPVTNSPMWIAAGTDPVGNYFGGHDFHVIVFDEKQLLNHRTFSIKTDYEHPENEFEFDKGNQTIIIRTPLGLVQKYDVTTDQVTDLR
jgi:hypothetical protein